MIRGSLKRIENIISMEKAILEKGLPVDAQGWMTVKRLGFSDAQLADLVGVSEENVRKARRTHNVHPVFKRVDSCAAEIPSETPYMYSTYEGNGLEPAEDECNPTDSRENNHPRWWPEPDRPRHRIRLLLCPRRLCAARSWL